jgi:hypothetical protein
MSPRPSRDSEPGIENGAGIHFAGYTERNAGREVGFDEARDDVNGWTLRRENQMDADGARHLRQSSDARLDVAGIHHHQVSQLVNDDDDEGKRLVLHFLGVIKQGK